MNKIFKGITFSLVVTLLMVSFVGCSGGNKTQDGQQVQQGDKITGSITAAGSTALQPLADEAAKAFTVKNPDATVNVQGGGSGSGLTQVSQGAVDIGNSDIFANEKSGIDAAALVDHKVCVVGFATTVNSKVTIDNLTKDQLIGIFTGKIKNWKEVNGPDMNIVVINRPKSSGTRATFKKYALDGNEEAEGLALTQDSNSGVKQTIQQTDGAIGYLALAYLSTEENRSGINILKYDGVVANKDNITSGKYPVWSYEHMYTKGEPSGLTKTFLDYMVSDEVKPIIEKLGYIAISDMKVEK